MRYDEKKAAQVAAFFIFRHEGRIEIKKLIKLMYLSERESFAQYDEPLTGDALTSMHSGPILSDSLNHLNKNIRSENGGFCSWINTKSGNDITLKVGLESVGQLTQLSDADIAVMNKVWNKVGHLSSNELGKYTHKHCGEWHDPGYSSKPIHLLQLFKNLGHNEEVSNKLYQRIIDQRSIDSAFDVLAAG